MLVQMIGEGAKNGMGAALGIQGVEQSLVKAENGAADGISGLGGAIADSFAVAGFVIVQRNELAVCLHFDGADLVFIFHGGFQL